MEFLLLVKFLWGTCSPSVLVLLLLWELLALVFSGKFLCGVFVNFLQPLLRARCIVDLIKLLVKFLLQIYINSLSIGEGNLACSGYE